MKRVDPEIRILGLASRKNDEVPIGRPVVRSLGKVASKNELRVTGATCGLLVEIADLIFWGPKKDQTVIVRRPSWESRGR